MEGAKTLNAWDAQLWLPIPLPLAEVGSRLNAAGADYLDRLIELAEDAIALASALALARIAARGARSAGLTDALSGHLRQPSLGKRIVLLTLLEREVAGCTGWDLDADASDLEPIFDVHRGSRPRRITVASVFGALTTIRNDDAHRRMSPEDRVAIARVVESVVLGLIRRNRRFPERLLLVEQARLTANGETELTARTLNGPFAASYRRGAWLPVGDARVLPGRVYLRSEAGEMTDVHPFVVARGERVFVLDQLRSSGPVLRHFASRSVLDGSVASDWAERWAAHDPVVDASASAEALASAVSTAALRPRSTWTLPALGFGVVGLLAGALVCAVAVLVTVRVSRTEVGSVAGMDSRDEEAPPVPSVEALADRLPRLFSGVDLRWSAQVTELEAARGPVPVFEAFPECARTLVDMREATWPGELALPQRTHTTLAFHRERGLFEVMVYSDADVGDLQRVIERELGAPHRMAPLPIWEYGSGERRVRVRVSRPRALGRSSIKVFRVHESDHYSEERRRLCEP